MVELHQKNARDLFNLTKVKKLNGDIMTDKLDKYLKIKKELSENRQRLGVIGLLTEAEVTTEVRAEQLTLRQRQPVAEGELQVAYDEQRAEQQKGVTARLRGTRVAGAHQEGERGRSDIRIR